MTSDRYVPTRAIREAVKGRELEVLKAVGIAWDGGSRPINCPYPDHSDANPSWRWNEARQRAHCTCDQRSHSIFDVVMRIEGLEFQGAKLRVAEILGREDLIKVRDGQRYQAMDAASLLHPPVHQRDDQLPRAYLGFRLDVPAVDVLMPSTPVAGGERSRITTRLRGKAATRSSSEITPAWSSARSHRRGTATRTGSIRRRAVKERLNSA